MNPTSTAEVDFLKELAGFSPRIEESVMRIIEYSQAKMARQHFDNLRIKLRDEMFGIPQTKPVDYDKISQIKVISQFGLFGPNYLISAFDKSKTVEVELLSKDMGDNIDFTLYSKWLSINIKHCSFEGIISYQLKTYLMFQVHDTMYNAILPLSLSEFFKYKIRRISLFGDLVKINLSKSWS